MAKKGTQEKRVKLLLCIIKKGDELPLTEACNELCPTLSFSAIGFGTAKSHYMSYLGLDEIEKRIVYSLIPDSCQTRLLRAIDKRLKLYLTGNGIAFTIPLSGISSLISNAILSAPVREENVQEQSKKSKKREGRTMHELIVAVVNQKYTDAVLDCSRAAGATGATVLHTRSVNNKQVEQLVGTSFQQETDTVVFLTTSEYKLRIMEAIRDCAGLKTEGGAILFSLPVDSLVGIGRQEEPEEDEDDEDL